MSENKTFGVGFGAESVLASLFHFQKIRKKNKVVGCDQFLSNFMVSFESFCEFIKGERLLSFSFH